MKVKSSSTYSKDLTHHFSSGASQGLAVVVEGLQIGFVEGVTDDLNVQLIQILLTDTLSEEVSCKV